MARKRPETGWLMRHAYAHRGLHGAGVPENSLAAFRAAMAAGLGIECDIRKAGDGRAVVFHDATLDRLTGQTGLVADHAIGQLTAMQLTGSHEHIPTLRDMLSQVEGKVPLLLELKTDKTRPVGPLCRAVRRDCEAYAGELAVMSFDPRVVKWFANRGFAYPLGLVLTEQNHRTFVASLRRAITIRLAKPDFLALDVRDLPSAISRKQAKAGRPLVSWTVDNAAKLETAIAAGAMPIVEAAGVAAWQSRS